MIRVGLKRLSTMKMRKQVSDKIDNLNQTYREKKKSLTTGSGKVSWPFYFELHSFLGSLPVSDSSLVDNSLPADVVKPVLYSQFLSSCSYRVRIVLALKHVDYEYKAIDLYNNEHHSPEFMNLNYMAQVPVLDIDGEQLPQSLAIIEYLDEKYPEPKLLPKDLILRQKARAIAELIVSGIHPLQNKSLLFRLDEEKRSDWALHYINKGFRALEAVLAKTAGQYCVGDSLTIADICLVPMVYQAKRLGVDMAPYPVVGKLNNTT